MDSTSLTLRFVSPSAFIWPAHGATRVRSSSIHRKARQFSRRERIEFSGQNPIRTRAATHKGTHRHYVRRNLEFDVGGSHGESKQASEQVYGHQCLILKLCDCFDSHCRVTLVCRITLSTDGIVSIIRKSNRMRLACGCCMGRPNRQRSLSKQLTNLSCFHGRRHVQTARKPIGLRHCCYVCEERAIARCGDCCF